jgi:hypothetical protein
LLNFALYEMARRGVAYEDPGSVSCPSGELSLAGGNYAATGVRFSVESPAAVEAEIKAAK